MKGEMRDQYLDNWGHECFICKAYVEREDMSLIKTIVQLRRDHEDVDGDTFQYYMVCPSCKKSKILV